MYSFKLLVAVLFASTVLAAPALAPTPVAFAVAKRDDPESTTSTTSIDSTGFDIAFYYAVGIP